MANSMLAPERDKNPRSPFIANDASLHGSSRADSVGLTDATTIATTGANTPLLADDDVEFLYVGQSRKRKAAFATSLGAPPKTILTVELESWTETPEKKTLAPAHKKARTSTSALKK